MQDVKAERDFYDALFTEKPDNEHITYGYEELYDLAFRTLPVGLVLDLGCGTGAHSIRLARRGCNVVSVDLTEAGARAAKGRLEAEGFVARCAVADAERLPFRDGAVDIVWAALLLHHFPRRDRVAAEIGRVARIGVVAFEPNAGNLLTWFAFSVVNRFWTLSTTTKNQRALSPSAVCRELADVGFAHAEVHFVDRGWSDRASITRRIYRAITAFLPERFRANKFLVVGRRPSAGQSDAVPPSTGR